MIFGLQQSDCLRKIAGFVRILLRCKTVIDNDGNVGVLILSKTCTCYVMLRYYGI